ncbi:PH domain-containing protein [Nocardia donostiensis]|uniref:Cytoplasmic protein n=1 Tax=Nocardia donostiensis TaxID=1538463 RepID=A0A1W0B9Z1_9NOCA|nr:PH domain-containing protein [Nocardia donostiensis]ONM49605.1 cytoplasmic protein [Nocardia donostiensis]OQS12897.1 cytoplasmic protein [Nocardia donostiensis]OQS19226.1 cytoplasmic protein [Nocardia donostiensis]
MGLMDGIMGNAGRLDPAQAQQEYGRLLGNGEQIYAAYILVRDAMLFTNRRLILVDKQGLSGRKVSYHSIPYRSITHFSVETAGTFDLDAELDIWISGNDEPVRQKFNRQVDIYEVQGILSHFVAV